MADDFVNIWKKHFYDAIANGSTAGFIPLSKVLVPTHSNLGIVDISHLTTGNRTTADIIAEHSKCECGAHSIGVDHHSTWCPRHS